MFGLSFLNTLFLWGLTAASLPIIIHLIRRNRAVKVPFAAMRFLSSTPKKVLRHQRLRQLLLLLVRVTALALLAIAFARPFFERAPAGGLIAETPKAVVLLLDHSLSMSSGNRLQHAAAEARKILEDTRAGDFVSVARFARGTEVMVEEAPNPRSLVGSASSWMQPSFGATSFRQALQTAENQLQRSPFPDKTIYVVSDFEASSTDIESTSYRLAPGIQLKAIPVGGDEEVNAAVTAVSLPQESGQDARLLAQIRVTGKGAGTGNRSIDARLVIDGKVAEHAKAEVKENGEAVVGFTRLPQRGGFITGYVGIEPAKDAIPADNRFYFVLRNRGKAHLLGISGEPPQRLGRDELFFVDRAFNLPGGSPFELVSIYPNSLVEQSLTDFQVVLLANVKTLDRRSVERLEYFVRAGGGLMISLGDQISSSYFNRAFADLAPASVDKPHFDVISRDRSLLLAQAEYYHPVFRAFEDPGHGDLAAAHFYQYFQVTPVEGADVLARFDNGDPAVLERSVGEGKVLLFTSTIDNEWSDLPVRPLFLPLLYQAANYLAPTEGQQATYLVGQPAILGAEDGTSQIAIRTPSGAVVAADRGQGYFAATQEPGIYEIRAGQERRYFAVNIDPDEVLGQRLDPEAFVDRFISRETGLNTATLASGAEVVDKEMENRQQLWRFLLIGVLVLLLGETFLANRTYR